MTILIVAIYFRAMQRYLISQDMWEAPKYFSIVILPFKEKLKTCDNGDYSEKETLSISMYKHQETSECHQIIENGAGKPALVVGD